MAGKRYLLAVVIVNGDGFDSVDYQPFVSDLSFGTGSRSNLYHLFPGQPRRQQLRPR